MALGLASRNLRMVISLNYGAGNWAGAAIGKRLQSGSPASKDRRKAQLSSVNDPRSALTRRWNVAWSIAALRLYNWQCQVG